MSKRNAGIRLLRENVQQQKQEIAFQCNHCGSQQTIALFLSPYSNKENDYDSDFSSKNFERENQPSGTFRENQPSGTFRENQLPGTFRKNQPPGTFRENQPSGTFRENQPSGTFRENQPSGTFRENQPSGTFRENQPSGTFRERSNVNEAASPVHRSNYALDFHPSTKENFSRTSLEQNIKGLVDGCVRSSIHDISQVTREADTQDIVEVEVEYDPILGNVKSTRKRSSTIITKLDNDYSSHPTPRQQSVNSRYKLLPIDPERDEKPIWARRRISHSTVKPSDLIREYDKKEKLEATAFRRLSRADLAGDGVIPNSTTRPMIISQNPTMIKDTILRWCQDLTQFYKGVNIRNFSSSWSDGLAFCAIIHRYFPDEFNFETLDPNESRQNFDLAFTVAFERAGIEPLIDTDDMICMGDKPDWKVVFTYVQSLYRHLSRLQPASIMRERW